MKKFITAALAALTAAACFAAVSCSTKAENVKVFKEVTLTEETYAFAIAKENTELLESVNAFLKPIKEDGSLDKLINSYFDGTAEFTYENKTSSPQKDDFIVATNAAFPPFEAYEGSAFKGIDIEIAYKIAENLGKNLFVKNMDFDAVVTSVETGESVIGMAGMTVTDSRLEHVNFAMGYYESAQVITVRESDNTFDACETKEDVEAILKTKSAKYTIGTQRGTTGFMYSAGDADFGYDGFKNLTTKSYKTGALAMKDLSNGKIDAVILDKQPSIMIAASINQ